MEYYNHFRIERYTPKMENEWNDFVSRSKNGMFLFDRRYMDYHADRFDDYSLMIYRKGCLYALLPAHVADNTLYSHQGLTYGGYIMNSKTSASGMLETVQFVNDYLKLNGINKIVYKPIPYIFHTLPSEEDLYAFFRLCNIKTVCCNISSVIYQKEKLNYDKSRRYGINKALRLGIKVVESNDFAAFWEILKNNLETKYGAKPVHTLDEIRLLRNRFPENIKLYLAQKGNAFVGGVVIYISKQVVRAQYASANSEGNESGALDLLFDYLINEKYADYPYFDFGPSTEQMGNYLNENLIFRKEGFGARGIVNNIYEFEL